MKTVRYLALTLALLWAVFWTLFFTAESLAWHTPLARMTGWVALGLAFVILALVAWRWEMVGGFVLMTVGMLAALAYGLREPHELPVTTGVATLLALSVPPVSAGALFLMHHYRITRLGGTRN